MKYGLLFSISFLCFSVTAHPKTKNIRLVHHTAAVMQQTLTPPEFPGGQSALFSYVMNNLKWPKNKNAASLQEVILTFYVEKDGSLTDFKIVKSLTPSFDASVIQLLQKSPKWIPAKRGNQPIKSKYDFPIRYHSEFETNDTN